MIQNYKVRNQIFYLFLQAIILSTFFLPGFATEKDDQIIELTGIKAIVSSDFPVIGQIVLSYIFISVIIHIVILVYEMINKKLPENLDNILTIVLTVQMIAGLLVVTFIGTYTFFFGFLMIGLILLSIFTKYKYFKS